MATNIDATLNVWLGGVKITGQYQKLFLTGCPKSGTTWLQNALNGHSQIAVNGEGRFAWRMYPMMYESIQRFNEDHSRSGGSPHGLIGQGQLTLVLRLLTDTVFLRYLNVCGKPPEQVRVIGDKTPQHILEHAALTAIYPGCRMINIVRDPRDAAASALFHLAKSDPRNKQDYVESFITQSWRLHVEAALKASAAMGPAAFLNIRYEDLHAEETDVLRQCLAFVGVDRSDQAIAMCKQAGSFERLSGGRARGQTDPNSFYRSGTVGDWKNHIEPALAERCCKPVAELMKRFGYGPGPKVDTTIFPIARTTLERAA